MSWQRRLRHIALTQVRAIKDRLDRMDAEMEDAYLRERQARDDALRELDDIADVPLPRPTQPLEQSAQPPRQESQAQSPVISAPALDERSAKLARAYRILGVPDGADLSEVEAAYRKLSGRCLSVEFAEGSEERQTAETIMARVNEAYNTLREELNPAAARFDKLEL